MSTQAITAVLDSLADAWVKGDADAYGAHFTKDASYITFVGTMYHGRNDIIESHRALFEKFTKGTKLSGEIVEVRCYGPDTAVVTGRGENHKGKTPKLTKVQTYTLVREADGQWRIAAFHNTKRRELMEAISFKFAPQMRPTGRLP